VLIASAGLRRQRSFPERLRFEARKISFKIAKRFVRQGPELDRLRAKFGSSDYRNAGALRPVFVRVVGEDLSAIAAQIACPTLLLYGSTDTETPPEMGERLHRIIRNSDLTILDGFGHLSILTDGRHQLALRIRKFLESVPR
jgi:pimeloyl-ACP methyl ester carboxylesterase